MVSEHVRTIFIVDDGMFTILEADNNTGTYIHYIHDEKVIIKNGGIPTLFVILIRVAPPIDSEYRAP